MVRDWRETHGDPAGDLYGMLGVAAGASQEAIVHAYRRQARAVHPDARPDDPTATARFRSLTGAYEVLSDPVRRADYDRAWRAPSTTRPTPQPGGFPPDQEGRGRTGEGPLGMNAPELGGGRPRPWRSHLWVGPVRVEASPREPSGELRRQEMSRHGELNRVTSLLLRILTDGWPE
jgi:curved DNA-binding protein CbpA